jgi:hypothetical protein
MICFYRVCPACDEHLEAHEEPWLQLCIAWMRNKNLNAFVECDGKHD